MKAALFLEYLWDLVFGETLKLRPELISCNLRHVEAQH